jgi:SAM-dependent methyltransferase
MFKEHNFTIWGTYCKCGNECSILQNKYHPWIDTEFTVKIKCSSCGNGIIVGRKAAEEFYNNKIYSYYNGLYGKVIDLGCGGGFLSRHLLNQEKVDKIYGIDNDEDCINELEDIIKEQMKFEFINSDISSISSRFSRGNIDFLVSRDVFMFIEDTERYFKDITGIVNKGIRQMGWYQKDNSRMRNKLVPEQIADEYIKRGWKVELEYLDWYKSGYFINAYKL